MKITPQEVELFTTYIFKISGITLDKNKGYLVENRLKPLLGSHGCTTYKELYSRSQCDKSGDIKREIIDAISTNETFFFRDNKPFDLLRNKIIPELIDRRQAQGFKKIPLRIWSAACSTGQEIYSIAMILHEILPNVANFDISILGTDISGQAVQRASYGKYNKFEMQRGLPEAFRAKYFTVQGDSWRIKDKIRAMAQFKKMNLLRPFSDIPEMDVVFCRNVAIYFNPSDKKKLFTNIAKIMAPDGALIVGGSETLTNISSSFKSQQYLRTIYYSHNTTVSECGSHKTVAPLSQSVAVTRPRVQPKKRMPHSIAAPHVQKTAKTSSAPAHVSRPPSTLKPPIAPTTTVPKSSNKKSFTGSSKSGKTSLLAELSVKQKPQGNSTISVAGQEKKGESLLALISAKKKASR